MKNYSDNKTQVVFILGVSLVLFIFSVVVVSSIIFLLGGVVSLTPLLIGLLVCLIFLYFTLGKDKKQFYVSIAIFLTIIGCSLFVSSTIIDSSFDGNWYHKEAVGLLKDGWNPLYENSNSFTYIYVDSYPKAAWIFAATLYYLTGNIESGKAINLLLIAATFLISYSFFKHRHDRNKSLMLSGLLALSPVAAMQLSSFYVDGAMGALLIILTLSLSLLIDKKSPPRWLLLLLIIAVISLVINLKFTGIVFAGITVFVFWLYLLCMKRWSDVKMLTLVGVISLVVGLLVIGSTTYITNYVDHRNPLYPLIGKGAVDIMSTNQPATYVNKNGIHKFIESNLGEVMNITVANDDIDPDSPLKVPFSVKVSEVGEFAQGVPDVRQAGNGVWFGGLLLVTFFVWLSGVGYLLLHRKNGIKLVTSYIPAILAGMPVVLIILLLEESWWARYVPQIILLPVLTVSVLFSVFNEKRVLPYVMLFGLYFNVILMTLVSVSYQQEHAARVKPVLYAAKEGCSNRNEFIVAGAMGYGFKYNVADYCKEAKFYRAQKNFDRDVNQKNSIMNDIYYK